MIRLNRTCKEVSSLVVAREDRALGLADRMVMKMHMAICENCKLFDQQMLTIRSGLKHWRNYMNDADETAAVVLKK